MNFDEAERRYAELRQRYDSGALSGESFDQALEETMVQAGGQWWSIGRDTGTWNYYDEARGAWVAAARPDLPVTRGGGPPAANAAPVYPDPSGGRAAPVYTPPAPTPTYPPQTAAPAGGPASQGMAVVLYILSVLVPIVGIVVFLVYRGRPAPSDKRMANIALVLGIISFVVSCFLIYASNY